MPTQTLRLAIFASSLSLIAAACGSSKPSTAAEAASNPVCETVTTQDLVAAGFASSPNACSSQMFTKYGDAGFQVVNGNIAKLALAASPNDLGPSFQTKIAQGTQARQTEFANDLLAFLEAAYGSSTPYKGEAMVPAHAELAITINQYKYFINDVVVPALSKSGVTGSDISNCFAPVVMDPNFVKTVVVCK